MDLSHLVNSTERSYLSSKISNDHFKLKRIKKILKKLNFFFNWFDIRSSNLEFFKHIFHLTLAIVSYDS